MNERQNINGVYLDTYYKSFDIKERNKFKKVSIFPIGRCHFFKCNPKGVSRLRCINIYHVGFRRYILSIGCIFCKECIILSDFIVDESDINEFQYYIDSLVDRKGDAIEIFHFESNSYLELVPSSNKKKLQNKKLQNIQDNLSFPGSSIRKEQEKNIASGLLQVKSLMMDGKEVITFKWGRHENATKEGEVSKGDLGQH